MTFPQHLWVLLPLKFSEKLQEIMQQNLLNSQLSSFLHQLLLLKSNSEIINFFNTRS